MFMPPVLRAWRGACLVLLGLAGALAALPLSAQTGRPAGGYVFSPVNQIDAQLTTQYWEPIIAYVAKQSGVPLALKVGRTSADTTSYVLAQEVDFVFSNHLFSSERQKLGWKVIGRRQTPPIYGQIVVAADSPITELAQLTGQTVAFPGPEALVAYKFLHAHLLAQGIEIKVVFGGNSSGAAALFKAEKVKAMGGNSQLIEATARRDKFKYRVLWTTEPLHDLALMNSSRVPAADAKAVAQAFANMHLQTEGLAILRRSSALVNLPAETSFVLSDGREYDAYRRFYDTAPPFLR